TPHAGDRRNYGAGEERVLRRNRRELERADARARRALHGHDRRARRLLRLAAADRVSPRGPRLRAAAAAAGAAAAPTPGAAAAQSEREGGVQSVLGGSGAELDDHGDGDRLDRLRGDVSLVGAERDAGAALGAVDAVDGGAAGRVGAGDGGG